MNIPVITRNLLNFKKAQNSKNLSLNGHTSFEFQTRNYITTQKYINMVLITV